MFLNTTSNTIYIALFIFSAFCFVVSCGWGTKSGLPWFSVDEKFEVLDGCYDCSFDQHCRLDCAPTRKNCPKRSKCKYYTEATVSSVLSLWWHLFKFFSSQGMLYNLSERILRVPLSVTLTELLMTTMAVEFFPLLFFWVETVYRTVANRSHLTTVTWTFCPRKWAALVMLSCSN